MFVNAISEAYKLKKYKKFALIESKISKKICKNFKYVSWKAKELTKKE